MVGRCILGMASLSARHPIVPHAIVSPPGKVRFAKPLAEPTLERDPLAIQGENI